jgi:hypothetical protein
MTKLEEQINRALAGGYPLVYLHTPDEERALQVLRRIADSRPEPTALVSWSCTAGLATDKNAEHRDPVAAIGAAARDARPGFYVFKDLPAFMDDPRLVRTLREAGETLATQARTTKGGATLFIVSPVLRIPETLERDVLVIDAGMAEHEELAAMVKDLLAGQAQGAGTDRLGEEIAYALGGLTLSEARHVARQTLHDGHTSATTLFAALHEAKKQLARRSAFLEYVSATPELDQVGGLTYLRAWIAKRAGVFNQRAVQQGVPLPRGILIMGVSGCGKSLCAKVAARTWRVPLFRLDMNLVFSNLYGNPEAAFHSALRAIESAAPAVLWIDEIEDGLGLENTAARPTHIISAFLTWMQEKPPLVFVAATANRIEALPAELIRKGRFDQVFFCDLPESPEREEIFAIHLKSNKADPGAFDLARLVRATEGWTAAEIAQAVSTARVEALGEKRAFTTRDILDYAANVVPLSRTMSEQIKRIRDWAWDRATPASRQSARELTLDK